jgi:hypothetical protein
MFGAARDWERTEVSRKREFSVSVLLRMKHFLMPSFMANGWYLVLGGRTA